MKGNDASISMQELKTFLTMKLTNYMIPNQYRIVEAFPLSPNGKVDRKALTQTTYQPLETSEKRKVRSPLDAEIQAIWAEILQVDADQISVFDNFFDIGGHSLSAMQVVARLTERYQVDVPVEAIFHYPTIDEMQLQILYHKLLQEEDRGSEYLASVKDLREEEVIQLLEDKTYG
jgi:acyl carrier protein